MSDGRKYYCFCDSNCKFETMTKEQILAAIAEATGNAPTSVDGAFITKMKEGNAGSNITIWVGTQAQYNALEEKAVNCLYIITDDTASADFLRACENALTTAERAEQVASGLKSVDFTKEVELLLSPHTDETGGQSLDELVITPLKHIYDPSTRLVHYCFSLKAMGTMDKGEFLKIYYKNNAITDSEAENLCTPPLVGGVCEYPICCTDTRLTAKLTRKKHEDYTAIYITAENGLYTGGDGMECVFSGWYYYGEGRWEE